MSAPKEVWVRVVDGRLQQDFCAIAATPETAPSNGVRYVLLTEREARALELVREALSDCHCKGTGFYERPCSMCHDSTWDHICNDERLPCERPWCVEARTILSGAKP